jgi:hypothetical protein
MTTLGLRKLRKIIIYCVSTFFIFSLSLLLMISYEFYIKLVNDNSQNIKKEKKEINQNSNDNIKQSIIERIDRVKVGYKENDSSSPHIFIIDVLKIGKCKYILVHSHINNYTDIELIHANDCENCKLINKENNELQTKQ